MIVWVCINTSPVSPALRLLRCQISVYKHFSGAGKVCINTSPAPERCFQVLPRLILPSQDDLLDVLNPFDYSQLKLVPSNVTVGATFNLDINEQPRRMNSEDIDPDVNLYNNEVLSGAQY